MSGPADDFLEAAESGDPAVYLKNQTDTELWALREYVNKLIRANQTKGGFPGELRLRIAAEADTRFFQRLTP